MNAQELNAKISKAEDEMKAWQGVNHILWKKAYLEKRDLLEELSNINKADSLIKEIKEDFKLVNNEVKSTPKFTSKVKKGKKK